MNIFHIKKCLVYLFTLLSFSLFANDEIPAEVLFKQPDIFDMSLSPQGSFLIERGRDEFNRYLNLVDTKTFKKYRIDSQSHNKASSVTNIIWLSENTLYVEYTKKRGGLINPKRSDAYIVKLDIREDKPRVEWLEIPIDGYVLSKQIDAKGKIIFAKTEGDYGEEYRLYQVTIDQLLAGKLGVFKKYRIGLSGAYAFYYDEQTDILVGHTFEDDQVRIWYLPADDLLWSALYRHDVDIEFTPIQFIDKNTLAVLTNHDSDSNYLVEFKIDTQSFGKVIYQHEAHDLTSASLNYDGSLHSISYIQYGVQHTEYMEQDDRQIKSKLKSLIPERKIAIVDTNTQENLQLVLAHESYTPGELYLFDKNSSQITSLGKLRKNLDSYALAKAEVFNVLADDGTPIEGIVTRPTGTSNGILLVNPHGGPIGVRDYATFNLSHQYYASRGYTILNVNFRGSSGFGKSYLEQGKKQFGQLIEQDIMAVYRHFSKENHFDNTCSIGSSYGGYSAMMLAIKHPEDFQCVISLFGIFDLPHLFSANNYQTLSENQEGIVRVIGENTPKLHDISPIKLAHKLQAPILIMAGDIDTIAPYEQSNRMKYVLQKLGKTVEFHTYQDTGHGHHNWTGDRHEHDKVHGFIQDTLSSYYQLAQAFQQQDLTKIKALINKSEDIDKQDSKGWAAMHYAVHMADEAKAIQVIDLLLAKGADIDIQELDAETPLFMAVELNKYQVAKHLMAHGADVNRENTNDWTPLFTAASEGYVNIAREILTYDVDLDFKHPDGWSALMFTTRATLGVDDNQQAEIAKMLIEKGAELEVRNNKGRTILMNASRNGKAEVVKVLIEAGADVNSSNEKDRYRTAFSYAERQKHKNLAKYLKEIGKSSENIGQFTLNQLIQEILAEDLASAKKLVDKLPYINESDDKGNSALHYAVKMESEQKSISLIKALLERGANINHANKRKVTPLYAALKQNFAPNKVILFLLENGADINFQRRSRWTPLVLAVSKGNFDVVVEMMKYSPEINHIANKGWSVFMYITNNYHKAKDEDQADVGRVLLKHGANIEARTKSGRTPLMNAAENGKLAVVKMLIEEGADIYAENPKQDKKTPLDYAKSGGHKEITKYLESVLTNEESSS